MPSAAPASRAPTLAGQLPAALARSYRLDPVGPGDGPAVCALVSACDVAVLGYPDVSLEDIEADLAPARGDSESLNAVVRPAHAAARGGGVVAWWHASAHPENARCFGEVYVDPTLDPGEGDAVAAAGWARVEQLARDFFARDAARLSVEQRRQALVRTGGINGDLVTERRLTAAGWSKVRTFWRMTADVPPLPDDAAPAPGGTGGMGSAEGSGSAEPHPAAPTITPTITPAMDQRLVHRLREETFADHWGHVAESWEAWIDRKRSEPGYDPSMWLVAEVDEEPAAFAICSRQMANDGALYIATLGTRAAYRGQGLASALLQRVFELARAEGFATVRLGVDSDNATGAPSLYRKAGFEVLFAMYEWHKPLGLA